MQLGEVIGRHLLGIACCRFPLTTSVGNRAKFQCCLTIAEHAAATAGEFRPDERQRLDQN